MATLQFAAFMAPMEAIMSARTPMFTLALALAAGALAVPAHALTITRAFSGLWVDATQPGRALGADVVQTPAGRELHAYWMARDTAGRTTWVRASGPVVGNRATLDAVVGGTATHWGKVVAAFDDCGHGTLTFQPDDSRNRTAPSSIVRASTASADGCTGGLSDDRVASRDLRVVEFLRNTGLAPAASGKTRFEERGDRTTFKVEVEDLPIGTYSLRVGGIERTTLDVASAALGTFAEVEFRSPVEPGKILLDFDPRGQPVEVAQGGKVYLARTLSGNDARDDDPGAGGGFERYVLALENGNDGPQMRALLDRHVARDGFSVELEDFAAGSYTLLVDGVKRATIDVIAVVGGTEGEVEFRDPPEAGHLPLDFDPRGRTIVILAGAKVVLSGLFPTVPSAVVADPDDDIGGHGSDDPPGDDHGGNGNDDPPGDDHGGNGNDDPPGDDHGGNGNDDPPGDDHGGNGNDDPPGDDHGGRGGDDDDDDHGGHGRD